jgi:chromate transporter
MPPNHMLFKRHLPFLAAVFKYACTAFGGPNAHIGAMTKYFVEKRKDITQDELIDFFSFCQLLPGPSSTQTVTLIGYKRGGISLAIATLILWCMPAIIIMTVLALFVTHQKLNYSANYLFSFIQPMAIGFLLYAAWQTMRIKVTSAATYGIMALGIIASILFHSPWVFPVLIIVGGCISNISKKRIEPSTIQPKKIKWINLALYILLFVVAGILSEVARVQHWQHARLFNLFENFYRFGSFVWGGGHALMSVMAEQFIQLPMHRGQGAYLSYSEYLTGFGMVNCVPGPVFSICSYIGGLSAGQSSISYQLAGSLVASVGVFLPSLLLVLFLYPIYNNLKQHVIIYRALEGIHAMVVGVMFASGINLIIPFFAQGNLMQNCMQAIVIVCTFLLLKYTKIQAPFIVLICLALGVVMHYV